MPGTASQAYKQVIEIEDFDNPGTFIDYSTWLHDGTLTINMDPIDTTTFGTNGWTKGIPGLKHGAVSVSYFNDPTFRSFIYAAINADAPFGVKIYPEGKVDGNQYWSFDGYLTGGGDGGAVAAAVGGSSTINTSGAVTLETYSA